ncbi:MAG: 30S ribosomal protein S7 [bacterium]
MRKKKKIKKTTKPDFKFNNITVAKFINQIMRQGKKNIAREIVYNAFLKLGDEPLKIFEQAIKNVGPQMELMSRRIGGANYQIPREVASGRKLTLAMRWIIESAKSKKGKPMAERLAEELKLAAQNQGDSIKKRENIHKMAEANRAFAHFGYRHKEK